MKYWMLNIFTDYSRKLYDVDLFNILYFDLLVLPFSLIFSLANPPGKRWNSYPIKIQNTEKVNTQEQTTNLENTQMRKERKLPAAWWSEQE